MHAVVLAVRFAGGLPQNLTGASTDEQAAVTFDVFRNAGNADKRDQRIVRVTADRVEYSARNFGARSAKKNATRKYAVALYRADSNSATVVPTDSLFSMTQCLEGMDDVEPDEVHFARLSIWVLLACAYTRPFDCFLQWVSD